MTIEQHAEDAARRIVEAWKCRPELVEAQVFLHREILVPRIKAAVIEATAERDATIAKQSARIARLEDLWPLIEEMKVAAIRYGEVPSESEQDHEWFAKMMAAEAKIDAILEGGD